MKQLLPALLREIKDGIKFAPVAALMGFAAMGHAQTDVLMWHNDVNRSGLNSSEAVLTPLNVNPSSFGLLYNFPIDGKTDAQPLYVSALLGVGTVRRNVVYVATEHDSVYAFDADTGHQYWKRSMLGANETTSDARNCGQVVPEIGITATPAINRTAGPHGTIYIVAMSKDAAGTYYQRIHALDLVTGAEQFGGPVAIQATYPGTGDNSSNGSVVFDPAQYKERPGLLLLNGTLYTNWSSHCDDRPYTGWTIGYNETTLKQTTVFNYEPNGSDASPWNAGAGPTVDAQGNIYISLGNGAFDSTLNLQGFPSQGDFGNSIVKLSTAGGSLKAVDYWAMYDTISESSKDVDLGSSGAMNLPDQVDADGKTRHLIVAAGKDTNIYVADRDNLGHFNSSSNSTLYQELDGVLPNGSYASPAYFNGSVYYGPRYNALVAFSFQQARLGSTPTSLSSINFAYPGTTPSVSAYGTAKGILWALENASPAVLHAYNPANLGVEFYNSNQAGSSRDQFGSETKFLPPTIANGKVFAGATGNIGVFGLLTPVKGPVPDGDYILKNLFSGLLLDDPRASSSPGVQIIQWSANNGSNQSWFFSSQGDGTYTIQNASSGLFLSYTKGATEVGSGLIPLLQQAPANDGTQRWTLTPTAHGYVVRNEGSGYVLDNPDYSRAQSTGIILHPANRGANQTWIIQ